MNIATPPGSRGRSALCAGGATDANFPFGFVQLNSYGAPDGPRAHPKAAAAPLNNGTADPFGTWAPGFPSLRWAQTQSLGVVPNSFQAVVLDTPSPSGAIHSCFKQAVGARLARGALATAYGRTHLQSNAALGTARRSGDNEVVVSVVGNVGGALDVRSPLGFEVLVLHPGPGQNGGAWHSTPIVRTDGASTITLSVAGVAGVAAFRALPSSWNASAGAAAMTGQTAVMNGQNGTAVIASLSGAAVAMHTRAHAITARMIMGMCMVGSVWSS